MALYKCKHRGGGRRGGGHAELSSVWTARSEIYSRCLSGVPVSFYDVFVFVIAASASHALVRRRLLRTARGRPRTSRRLPPRMLMRAVGGGVCVCVVRKVVSRLQNYAAAGRRPTRPLPRVIFVGNCDDATRKTTNKRQTSKS
ncbi:hypothetical protein GUJ93_ZPchr0006g46249 [Zizania palustris]|uniref:Uncharacterized protein n=1 Tax=Zizania palustris TaxID=103762 RepID=A0A8J5SFD2_ZIZPA|nr:hypothetical protein GUJ93_ZPchr0006g46249 [Zizania palustris]